MKKFFILVCFIILTFPAYKALRHIGMVSGHDAEAAVFKAEEYYNALKDGHFPPRWSKRLDYGLGQPTFTFTYTLPYVLTSIPLAAGIDPVSAYKLIMAATFPVGAFFAYLWLSKRFGTWPGIAGGIVYAFSPYHFANVYVRGAIGETVASAILPLSFYTLDRIIEKPSPKNIALGALAIATVILSHPFYGMIFSLVWIGYVAINKASKKNFVAIALGYLICSFYIIPALVYKNLTYLDRIEDYFLEKLNFVSFQQLLSPTWGYAAVFETNKDPMSVQIGLVAVVVLLGMLAKITDDKKNRKIVMFFLALTLFAIFMMLSISLPIWKIVSPLRAMQFPWRLLFIINLTSGFAAGYVLSKSRKKVFVSGIVILLSIFFSRDYWYVNKYYPATDLPDLEQSIGYPGTLTMLMEETPKWHMIRQEANPYDFFNVESKNTLIKSLIWRTNYHKYIITTDESTVISDKTHYWPGWKVYLNGEQVKLLDPYDSRAQGLLTFEVGPGTYIGESRLTEPGINKVANILSLAALGTCGMLLFKSRKYEMA